MSVKYLHGDLFLSRAQTLAHGVNCRGRMGAGIAVEFRRRYPNMYKEYRQRCHREELRPGDLFLWKDGTPWILNLATQDRTSGARFTFVEECLTRLARDYANEGIASLAMPRIAAGLGGLAWSEVRELIDFLLGPLPIPVFVYEEYVEELAADEGLVDGSVACAEDREPILLWGNRHREWQGFSNMEIAPFTVDGKEYRSVEHYFQASKATTEWEHEMVRNATTPVEAKRLGREMRLRPDWEDVKLTVMRTGLHEKFRQNAYLGQLLLSTGNRPIHENSPHDAEWGWMNGAGQDLLGSLLIEIRPLLRAELHPKEADTDE